MTPARNEPRPGSGRAFALLQRLAGLVRLCWRLLRDGRVPLWPKLVLAAVLVYVVLPFDLLPDALPLVGQLDDLTLIVLFASLFIRWCPPEIVREHSEASHGGGPGRAG